MSLQWVLLPLFVHVIMTFLVPVLLGGWRGTSAPGGEVYARPWLHLPLLFYVLTILAQNSKMTDLLFVLLAWVFVVLQVLDALMLVRGNGAEGRAMLLPASALVLAIMWAIFIVRILLAI
jgi:hypothetical protein